jgi:two-component system, cell cycle response regulator DivK
MGNNILCIEDNSDNLLLLRRILESSGHCLLQAKNGLDGITIAEREEIDLILLDINLPDIDGYEVTRKLRASQKHTLANIPIIVCSANAMIGDAQKALSAGCNVYMTKPIDIHELSAKVESFLSLSQ